jgi:hypothetical protein
MKQEIRKVFGGLVSAYWYVPDPVTQLHGTGEELNLLVALLEADQKIQSSAVLEKHLENLDEDYKRAINLYNPVAGGHKEALILLHRIRQQILVIAIREDVIDIESIRQPMFSDVFGQNRQGAE